jgi:hypothetical protein
MKRIVFLTYFFEPDLSAGSFRNSSLVKVLGPMAEERDCVIDVFTSTPNRYETFQVQAHEGDEVRENVRIHRFSTVQIGKGKIRAVIGFLHFFFRVLKANRGRKTDLVYASSSKLLNAYLGYRLARRSKAPLYLDIRDLFVVNMKEIVKSRLLKFFLIPFLNHLERRAFRYASHINLVSGGFRPLFKGYTQATVTEYTNGIDDMFLNQVAGCESGWGEAGGIRTILYAGNIGDGQGLYKIIPRAAQLLGDEYRFIVYGDGGQRGLLKEELARLKVDTVRILKPVQRPELIRAYCKADYLFIHLNNYAAFEKVLPSKIFELASFPKPLIAGVGGFPKRFIESEIPHSFVFAPGDAEAMVQGVRNFRLGQTIDRQAFIDKYRRSNINLEMAQSVLRYLDSEGGGKLGAASSRILSKKDRPEFQPLADLKRGHGEL